MNLLKKTRSKKVFLLYLMAHLILIGQSDAELEGGALQGLLALPEQQIGKISLEYEHQLESDKGPLFFKNFLIWNLKNSNYFWKREQFNDKSKSKLQQVVVRSWDGSDSYFWTREVNESRPELGLLNGEPCDPGTVVRLTQPVFSPLIIFQSIFESAKFLGRPLEIDKAERSISPSLNSDMPGQIVNLSYDGWSLSANMQTGWLLKRSFHGIGIREETVLSQFGKIGKSDLYFPHVIMRTMTVPPEQTYSETYRIKPDSVKINNDVVLPKLLLPPDTHVQDDVTGTFRIIKDDTSADALEARLRFLLKQAEEQATSNASKTK